MITKVYGLQHLIDRIENDKPLGIDPEGGICKFSHDIGGGCAIGALLPAELAAAVPNFAFSQLIAVEASVRELFEDPYSQVWSKLQQIHDGYALTKNSKHSNNPYNKQGALNQLYTLLGEELL